MLNFHNLRFAVIDAVDLFPRGYHNLSVSRGSLLTIHHTSLPIDLTIQRPSWHLAGLSWTSWRRLDDWSKGISRRLLHVTLLGVQFFFLQSFSSNSCFVCVYVGSDIPPAALSPPKIHTLTGNFDVVVAFMGRNTFKVRQSSDCDHFSAACP